jgi:NUMOD4 motif
VPGWEGSYEVSDRGQVRSLDRIVPALDRWGNLIPYQRRGVVLKQRLNRDGYPVVGLAAGGHTTTKPVHVLVLSAFAGTCPRGSQACHGPGGRADNRWPENLSWGTAGDNHGRDRRRDHTTPRGEHDGNAKLTWEQVCEIRMITGTSQQVIADAYGVTQSTISKIRRGRLWQHPPEEW